MDTDPPSNASFWFSSSFLAIPAFLQTRRQEHIDADEARPTQIPSQLSSAQMSDHTPLSSHEISLLTNRLDWGGSWDGIDLNSLGTNCPLDNGRIKARKRKSTKHGGLGALHILPSEILCRVFGFLDLQSLADIRAVNWSIRDFVDGIPQYKLIIKHAPNALRALLSTERAESFTLFDLFRTLHTPDCSICGEFGALLDLFSCRRQCVKCATVSGENATMPLNTAKTKFKLTSNVFRQLPVCHTLPGDYKYSRPITAPPYKRRMRLVRVRSVADAIKKHGLSSSELEAWRDGNIGLHYTEREKYGRVAYSVMALMVMPCLDLKTGQVSHGVYCQGCRHGFSWWSLRAGRYPQRCADRDRMHDERRYFEHFKQCTWSQKARKELPKLELTLSKTSRFFSSQSHSIFDRLKPERD